MPDQPNVLLVLCDQLNSSVLDLHGGPVETPNIDRLASNGTDLMNATCPTPLCSPSRAALSTGRYPHANGITHNVMRGYPAVPSPPTEMGITRDDATLGRLFDEAGYTTHHYGKWHLEDADLPYYPDAYTEHREYAQELADTFREVRKRPREEWMDWYGWALPVEVSRALEDAIAASSADWNDRPFAEFITKMGRLNLPPEETFDVRVADRTVERIETADEPFFLTCSFNLPHDPNVVPSPYYERYDPAEIDLPETVDALEARFAGEWSREIVAELGEPVLREFLRCYYASVELVDDQVGRILDALDERGLTDETIVAFTSDHGDMAGEHGMVWKSTSAFYDGILRVPLVVRTPEETVDETDVPCGLTDLLPTLLDLADIQIPDGVQGESLVSHLRGESSGDDERYAFVERVGTDSVHTRTLPDDVDGAFAIRGRRFKYVWYPDGEEFLYDLQSDAGETRNLADDPEFLETKRAQRDRLSEWLEKTDYPGEISSPKKTGRRL